jgi:hypothetical protein
MVALPKGSSRNREVKAKNWKQYPVGEPGLCSMVNVSKSLLNVVKGKQAKIADKPEPKGTQSDVLLYAGNTWINMTVGG